MSPYRLSLSALALASLFSCGPGVQEFCEKRQAALAARAFECHGGSQRYWNEVFTAKVDCVNLVNAEKLGFVAYDSGKTKACLAAVQAAPCSGLGDELPEECAAVLVGKSAELETCYRGMPNCQPGLVCPLPSGVCNGRCERPVVLGGDCSQGKLCERGYACAPSSKACVSASASDGQTCDVAIGPFCASTASCVVSTSGSTQGTCKTRTATGSCQTSLECSERSMCVGATSSAAGSCVARKKQGEACTPGNQECEVMLHCDTGSKTCVEPPAVRESCDPGPSGDAVVACLGGYCNPATKQCTNRKDPIAKCSPGEECAGASACDSSGTCPWLCLPFNGSGGLF